MVPLEIHNSYTSKIYKDELNKLQEKYDKDTAILIQQIQQHQKKINNLYQQHYPGAFPTTIPAADIDYRKLLLGDDIK